MSGNTADYTDDQRKILDAIKASSSSVKDISFGEAALSALKNSGVSMESFKIRQDVVDALNGGRMFKGTHWTAAKLDADDTQLGNIFDQLMQIHHEERMKKMTEEAVAQFHNAMASLPESKVLPVWMEINGVRTKVGDALIDPTEKGFCILHAIIDGQEHTTALLKGDEAKIFIGNRDDFKKES